MSNNGSVSSGATIFQQKMILNKQRVMPNGQRMSSFDALRKVANNMIREQNIRIAALEKLLEEIKPGKDNPDIQLSQLLDLYSNVKKESAYFEEYSHEIKSHKNSRKLNVTLINALDEVGEQLDSIKTEMVHGKITKSIMSSIYKLVPNTMDMKDDISGLINTFNNNPSIIQTDKYKSNLKEHKNKKNIIDNSLIQLNKWLEKCEIYGDIDQIEMLRIHKIQLLTIQKGINKTGLSSLMVKEIAAEFMSKDGLMQDADDYLKKMDELSTILDDNLKKYNAKPTQFGANYDFSDDTGEFRVISPYHVLSRVGFHSSKNDFDNFIEKFAQECVELEKIEDVDLAEKRQILKMKDQLVTNKMQLDEKLEVYYQRVDELKSQIPMNIVEDINNKTVENLASMMAEKQEQDVVSSVGNARHSDVTHLAVMPVEMSV